jgi:hypothetical protein
MMKFTLTSVELYKGKSIKFCNYYTITAWFYNIFSFNIQKFLLNSGLENLLSLQLEDLTQFYNQEIKPISYNVAIMGKKENLDHSAIENLGDFQDLSLEEIFGY